MPTTLVDIAKETSTSVSTVSRVLAGGTVSRRISPATRERVHAAATRLGYRPNLIARTLRTRRSHTVALLVSDFSNPFFAQLGSLIERHLHSRGYSLMLCNSGEDARREADYLALLAQKAIDGLIVVPLARTKASLQQMVPPHLPLVILDRPIPGVDSAVYTDLDQSSDLLAGELRAAGVRRIALIAGPDPIITHQHRARSMSERFDVVARHLGPVERVTGAAAYAAFRDAPFDAVVCTNNFLAEGVIEAVGDSDRRPVIGVYDEIPMMAAMPFPIVAVCQDVPMLAERSVDQLLGQLDGSAPAPSPVVLHARIMKNRAFDEFRSRQG